MPKSRSRRSIHSLPIAATGITSKPAARDGIMHKFKPWFALVLVLGVALLGRAQHTDVTFSQLAGQATPVPAPHSSLKPSTYGQTITLSATLPSGATGTVQFYDGSSAPW